MTIVNDKEIIPENLARDIPFFITSCELATADVATTQAFKLIRVEVDGDVVLEGPYGNIIFIPAVTSGEWVPTEGVKILSSSTAVTGFVGTKTTTATGIWCYGGM